MLLNKRNPLSSVLSLLLLLPIIALAAYLRLTNLPDNPAWYTDETTHIDIARHLTKGEVRYLAVQDSTLLFARMPLFEYTLAAVFRLSHVGIDTLRLLTACLGVFTVALLYAVVRGASGGGWLALSAALMLAIYPQAVVYSRFGFSYNLLPPFLLLTLLGMVQYAYTGRKRWLALTALTIGVGILSDLVIFGAAPVLLLLIVYRRHPLHLVFLPLLFLPFAIYAALMLLSAPEAFLFDLRYTLTRVGGVPLVTQAENILNNYVTLLTGDRWILAGVIGLFALRPLRLGAIGVLLFFVPIAVMGRTAALYGLSFYYMIPLLPLIALGAASLIVRGVSLIIDGLRTMLPPSFAIPFGAAIACVMIGSPLMVELRSTVEGVRTYLPSPIDPFLVNPDHARLAADYLNTYATPDAVIIASPPIGYLLNANAVDFQMSVAATGQTTPHLPGDLPPERWAFDPRFENASFVVIDHLWRNWGVVHVPTLDAIVREIESSWSLVLEAGEIRVYAR